MTSLEPHQQTRLASLEQTVRDGLRDFQQTGQALAEIRDNGLYRATHESFEAYLSERWGFTLPQAGRLIDAAEVVRVLSPIGVTPRSEREARSLKAAARLVTDLEPEAQRVVARLVQRGREGPEGEPAPWEDAPPAAELRIMANVVRKLEPGTTVYHPDSGDEVPFDSLSAPQRFEVVQTHVDQKTQAYRDKQAAKAQQEPQERVNWAAWCMAYAEGGLGADQRLEIVLEHGEGGQPVTHARIVDKATGEVLAEGGAGKDLRRGVTNLIAQMSGQE